MKLLARVFFIISLTVFYTDSLFGQSTQGKIKSTKRTKKSRKKRVLRSEIRIEKQKKQIKKSPWRSDYWSRIKNNVVWNEFRLYYGLGGPYELVAKPHFELDLSPGGNIKATNPSFGIKDYALFQVFSLNFGASVEVSFPLAESRRLNKSNDVLFLLWNEKRVNIFDVPVTFYFETGPQWFFYEKGFSGGQLDFAIYAFESIAVNIADPLDAKVYFIGYREHYKGGEWTDWARSMRFSLVWGVGKQTTIEPFIEYKLPEDYSKFSFEKSPVRGFELRTTFF